MQERQLRDSTGELYAAAVRDLQVEAPVDVTPCLVCGSGRARPRFAVEGVDAPVVVCVDCGVGRFHPMPSAEQIREFYPDEYYGEPGEKFQPIVEGLVRRIAGRHIGFISRGLRPGARVLDVGCGRGVILTFLADRGFEVHGVELSPEAAQGADSRAEIRIAQRLGDAGYDSGTFDEVVIWHVLEHLGDPRETLVEALRILRPGGRLVVAVPNFSSLQARWTGSAWFHLDLPRHLYHFPLAALRRLLVDIGFEVESEHHFSLRQNPFGWVQSYANRRRGLPRNGLYTVLHRRGRGESPPFDALTRLRLWCWLAVAAPVALVALVVETLFRSGATFHLVATKPASSRP